MQVLESETKIPKIINYVWLGGKKLPKREETCVDTWKKFCPDYEIVEWNEHNFDIDKCLWAKQALDNKIYAFASDAVRMYALYKNGGIYLDTDVYLVKNLDAFLEAEAFIGYEGTHGLWLGPEIIGAQKNNAYIKYLYSYYYDRPLMRNGKMQNMSNVMAVTELTKRYYGGFKANGKEDILTGENKPSLKIYPHDVFFPKDYMTGKLKTTQNTAAVHDFASVSGWLSPSMQRGAKFAQRSRKVMGRHVFKIFERIVKSAQTKVVKKSIKEFPLKEIEI